jgi:hypothetical protein
MVWKSLNQRNFHLSNSLRMIGEQAKTYGAYGINLSIQPSLLLTYISHVNNRIEKEKYEKMPHNIRQS